MLKLTLKDTYCKNIQCFILCMSALLNPTLVISFNPDIVLELVQYTRDKTINSNKSELMQLYNYTQTPYTVINSSGLIL